MAESEATVVVGLAGGRGAWTSRTSRWSMSTTAAVEFLRCLSADEVRAVLAAGRQVALLLLDSAAADRDLVDLAARLGTPTVLVQSSGAQLDWSDLGCADAVDDDFDPEDVVELLDALRTVDRSAPPAGRAVDLDPAPQVATLVAVCGAGGSGCTTVAMLIAHGVARRSAAADATTVLVDGTRTDGLALYHDLVEPDPGLDDLVERHRRDRVDPDEIRSTARTVPGRPYSLITGGADAAPVTTSASTAAAVLDGLRRSFRAVVVDAGDIGGAGAREHPHATGTVALAAVESADVAVVVGRGDLHGVHRLATTADTARSLRDGAPLLLVCTQAPRSPLERRAITGSTVSAAEGPEGRPSDRLVFVPHLRTLERVHRDVLELPERGVGPLAGVVAGHTGGHTVERTTVRRRSREAGR